MEGRLDRPYGLGAIEDAFKPIMEAKALRPAEENHPLNAFYQFIDKLSRKLYKLPSRLPQRANVLQAMVHEMQVILGLHEIMRISNPTIRAAFVDTAEAIRNYIAAISPGHNHTGQLQSLRQMSQGNTFFSHKVHKQDEKEETTFSPGPH